MKITKYWNTNEKEVKSRKFNIFIGISLGNLYFSKENIRKYILWALENTKKSVLIFIADKNHSINLNLRKNYSKKEAINTTIKMGDEIENSIRSIINGLPKEKQKLVKIMRWEDLEKLKEYQHRLEPIKKEFSKNKNFKSAIMNIVTNCVKIEKDNLKIIEGLSLYVLNELPLFIDYIEYQNERYNLIPYPGGDDLNDLALDIQNGKLFPELTKKLKPEGKMAFVNAYVD
jgi:tRNA-dependent cyclodipeptide synthase